MRQTSLPVLFYHAPIESVSATPPRHTQAHAKQRTQAALAHSAAPCAAVARRTEKPPPTTPNTMPALRETDSRVEDVPALYVITPCADASYPLKG